MASAVYTEPPASRLSISLEGSASASPFPSPSSSFLPPPTPGAHEFAIKPAPPARSGSGGRKSSNPQPSPHRPLLSSSSDSHNGDASSLARQCDGTDVAAAEKTKSQPTSSSLPSSASQQQRASLNGLQVPYAQTNGATEHPTNCSTSALPIPASPSLVSPVTPTPYSIQRHPSPPPVSEGDNAAMLDPPRLLAPSAHAREGSSSTTTPTKQSSSLPPESVRASASALASTSSSSTESPVAPAPAATAVAAAAEPPELPLSKIIIPDLDQSTLSGGEQSSGSAFGSAAESTSTSKSRSRPPSSALSAISTTNADPSLFSNRPAPPSPISRRVSKAYSTSSARSRSSRPPSTSVSRANSVRKNNANANANTTGNAGTSTGSSARGSPVMQSNVNRQSIGGNQLVPPLSSPHNLVFALTSISTSNSNSNANANSALTPTPSITSPPVSAAATAGSGNSLPVTPATATPSSSSLSQAQAQAQAQKRASVITTTTAKVYIKIRDYAYPPADERHVGLGPDVPKANKVVRLNRRLGPRTLSQMSAESREGDDEVDEDGDEGGQLDGFRIGLGRLGLGMGMGMGAGGVFRAWGTGAGGYGATAADIIERDSKAGGAYPSRSEMDINFLEGNEGEGGYYTSEGYEEEYDPALEGGGEEGEGEEEEDILYPGLYRALYAFEPEGTAEMRLEEDQLVHVVGRGGGVGWAVVIDEKGTSELVAANGNAASGAAPKHALVPESYLEPVRLDWEDEQEGLGVGAADATSA